MNPESVTKYLNQKSFLPILRSDRFFYRVFSRANREIRRTPALLPLEPLGLLCLDDRAPDRPRPGEEILQFVALAPTDRALQGGQVFVEALQDLEHRFAVVEKNVAPHHRIGGGYPGEVAKPAGREFDDLGFEAVLEVSRGADDRIGDQVRQ